MTSLKQLQTATSNGCNAKLHHGMGFNLMAGEVPAFLSSVLLNFVAAFAQHWHNHLHLPMKPEALNAGPVWAVWPSS